MAKLVSKAWKALPTEERERWDEIARQDKERYEIEKMTYTGPWKVPIYTTAAAAAKHKPAQQNKKTVRPPPPTRPLSAFLSFSNAKREYVKNKYQDAITTNADIPSILAQLWKDADPIERKVFLDEQFRLEQSYDQTMVEWEQQSSRSSTNNNEPLSITTSMSSTTNSTAYSTDMAATIFDDTDLSPYASLSTNSGVGIGADAGAGPTSSTIHSNNGGRNQHNDEGQYQQQQQQQFFPHYDYAYQYRNPYYGETHNTNGYHRYSYDSSARQQHSYEYNEPTPTPLRPLPPPSPLPYSYDHHQQGMLPMVKLFLL